MGIATPLYLLRSVYDISKKGLHSGKHDVADRHRWTTFSPAWLPPKSCWFVGGVRLISSAKTEICEDRDPGWIWKNFFPQVLMIPLQESPAPKLSPGIKSGGNFEIRVEFKSITFDIGSPSTSLQDLAHLPASNVLLLKKSVNNWSPRTLPPALRCLRFLSLEISDFCPNGVYLLASSRVSKINRVKGVNDDIDAGIWYVCSLKKTLVSNNRKSPFRKP